MMTPPHATTLGAWDHLVACAILKTRAVAGAFLRLGREACPQLRWRCEGVAKALMESLSRSFREFEQ